jgi:transposase
MSKYTRELKFIVAKEYLDGMTPNLLGQKYSVPSKHIRYWAQVYSLHGEDSFAVDGQSVSTEFKREAIELMWTNNWSIRHTSAVLNLSFSTTLTAWLNKYKARGIKGLENRRGVKMSMKKSPKQPQKSDDEMTLEELREELAYLRAENAALKKLEELKQQRLQRTKKKR